MSKSPRKERWEAFSVTTSFAMWNLAKVFHFLGRVAGRIAEEVGYEDDFPFGTRPLERSPEEVNVELDTEYPAKQEDAVMKYWFQTED